MAYDLAIVGAGPAGAAAALTACRTAPTARVVLLDRATFPRDKPCGDAVSPDAVAELAKLGATDAVAGETPVDRLRLRSPAGIEVADTPPAIGYVVPRTVFDARLVRAAVSAGAELRRATVRGITVERDTVAVTTATDVVRARVVIGADGANSVVRRSLTVPASTPRHTGVAVRAYAPAAPGPPELLLAWEQATVLAYAWSFPIDGTRTNIGYGVFGTDEPPSRRGLVERMEALLPQGRDADPATVRGHRLPLSSGGVRLGAGRVLLAGDAASLINPITGEGIYYALLSGRLAAWAALREPGTPLRAYRATVRTALGGHVRSTRVVARLPRSRGILDLLVDAARRSPAALEILADLAFGKGVLTLHNAGLVAAAAGRAALPRVLAGR